MEVGSPKIADTPYFPHNYKQTFYYKSINKHPIMKPHVTNLVNSIVLIAMGLWGYLSSETPSPTALIPVVAVVLTLFILIALSMPFKGAMGRGDNLAMGRIGLMMLTGLIALVSFIISFIDARKAKN